MFGPPDIEKMKLKRDVKGLIKALTYNDDHIRREAASALGEIGDRQAVNPLIVTLYDNTPFTSHFRYAVGMEGIRSYAARALGKIRDPLAVLPLLRIATNGQDPVRHDCIEALGMIGDESAVEPLIQLLKDEISIGSDGNDVSGALVRIGTPAIKALTAIVNNVQHINEPIDVILKNNYHSIYWVAMDTLKKIGWQADNSLAGLSLCVYKGDWIEFGLPVLEILITLIKCGSDEVRNIARVALEKMSDVNALDRLLVALRDENACVRKSAAIALGTINDQRIIEPLLSALKDIDEDVLRAVTQTLGGLKGKFPVDPLVDSLKNGNWKAAHLLKELEWQPDEGWAGAAFWIGLAIRTSKESEKEEYWKKCFEIGMPAIEPLKRVLLTQRRKDCRIRAAGILEQLGWKPELDEIGAAYWVIKADWDKCIQTGVPAVNQLIAAMNEGSTEAALALVKIGDPSAASYLNRLIEDYLKSDVMKLNILGKKILLLSSLGNSDTIKGLERIISHILYLESRLQMAGVQTESMDWDFKIGNISESEEEISLMSLYDIFRQALDRLKSSLEEK